MNYRDWLNKEVERFAQKHGLTCEHGYHFAALSYDKESELYNMYVDAEDIRVWRDEWDEACVDFDDFLEATGLDDLRDVREIVKRYPYSFMDREGNEKRWVDGVAQATLIDWEEYVEEQAFLKLKWTNKYAEEE